MKNKVAVKKTPFVTIKPAMGIDTLNGKPISNSTIAMGYHLATYGLEYKGKKYEMDLIGGGGCTVSVKGEHGRQFHINMASIINHAIEHGLLDSKIDFKESE